MTPLERPLGALAIDEFEACLSNILLVCTWATGVGVGDMDRRAAAAAEAERLGCDD